MDFFSTIKGVLVASWGPSPAGYDWQLYFVKYADQRIQFHSSECAGYWRIPWAVLEHLNHPLNHPYTQVPGLLASWLKTIPGHLACGCKRMFSFSLCPFSLSSKKLSQGIHILLHTLSQELVTVTCSGVFAKHFHHASPYLHFSSRSCKKVVRVAPNHFWTFLILFYVPIKQWIHQNGSKSVDFICCNCLECSVQVFIYSGGGWEDGGGEAFGLHSAFTFECTPLHACKPWLSTTGWSVAFNLTVACFQPTCRNVLNCSSLSFFFLPLL